MAIVRVQAPAISQVGATSATTITNTFASNVTAGNLLVAIACGGNTGTITQTITSPGATWVQTAKFLETGSPQLFSINYCENAPGGATTVTCTYSSSQPFRGLIIAEYSGAAISGALDVFTTGLETAATATPTDNAMVTTADGDLIVSALCYRNATSPASAGAGFTAIAFDNAMISDLGAEDQVQTSQGSIAGAFGLNSASAASGIMSASFKAAVAAGTPSAPQRLVRQVMQVGGRRGSMVAFVAAGFAAVTAGQTITAASIDSAQVVGAATATPGAVTVTATGIPPQELIGVAQVSQQLQATGISSGEALGTPATIQAISATGIPSAQAVGTTTSTLFVSPAGISSTEQAGQATVAQAVATTGIPSQERAGSHVVTPGAVTITTAGIASAERAGAVTTTTVSTIVVTGIPSVQATGQATIGQAISAVAIPSSELHGAHTISAPAGVTINATGIPSGERVSTQDSPDIFSEGYGPFVVTNIVSPQGIPSAEQFGNATTSIVGAPQTITATGVPSAQGVGTALVGRVVVPAGILSAEALGAVVATPGAVTISPASITSNEALGAVIVAIAAPQSLNIAGITSDQRFGTAQVAQALSATGIPSAERAGNSVVTPGAVTLSVAGISSQQIFGTPFVSLGLTLTIASIQSAQRFGDSAIIPEGVPEAILASTNLAGFVTAIRDNPSSPDSDFLTAVDQTATTDLRVSFITPFKQPGAVGGSRTFRAYVRRTSNAGANPNAIIELWESGVFRRELATTSVTSTSGQLIEAAMDPADLVDATGAGVELRLRGAP